MEIAVGRPTVTTHFDDEVVVCELSGEIVQYEGNRGYFAADTASRLGLPTEDWW